MKLPARIQNWARGTLGIVEASYDAIKWSPNRSNTGVPVQDVDADLRNDVLAALRKRSRYICRESPTVHGLVERMVTYIIGTGIYPSAASTDEAWNKKASGVFSGWSRHADAVSRASFSTLQQIIARSVIVDGEVFLVLTYGASGRPRIQLLEAHRIEEIKCDALGRPISYILALPTGSDPSKTPRPAPLPAESIVHIYRPERAGQKRGVPLLAAAINTAQDVDEILGFEKAAVKENSSVTKVIKTRTGELNIPVIGRSRYVAAGTDTDAVYKSIVGPSGVVIKNDEEYNQLVSQRPSMAWQGFVDFLAQTVCLAANMPPSVFLQIKVGGADTRRDLAAAQRVVEQWQQILADSFQRVWDYVIDAEQSDGPLGRAPADWRAVTWQYPPKVTVDEGRTSNADREDVRAGLMTWQEYYGRYGLDYREQLSQRVKEQKLIVDLASEHGVEPSLVLNILGQAPGGNPMDVGQPLPNGTT